MVISDLDIFASGRAATILLKFQPNSPALTTYKTRVMANNWQSELVENIPNPDFRKMILS